MGKPWKELEKKTAEALEGYRINRADDYGRSATDVVVPWIPELKVDCKYRSSHAHHSLIEEIRSKYCSSGEWPVLVTKHRGSHREFVTIDLSLFASMLTCLSEYGIIDSCLNASTNQNTLADSQTTQSSGSEPEIAQEVKSET